MDDRINLQSVPETAQPEGEPEHAPRLNKAHSWAVSDPDSDSVSPADSDRSDSPEVDHGSLCSSTSTVDEPDLAGVQSQFGSSDSVVPIRKESYMYLPGYRDTVSIDEGMTTAVHSLLFRQHLCFSCDEVYPDHTAWSEHVADAHGNASCSCTVEGCQHSEMAKSVPLVREKLATLKAFFALPNLDNSTGQSLVTRFFRGEDIEPQLNRSRAMIVAGLGKRRFQILMSLLNVRKDSSYKSVGRHSNNLASLKHTPGDAALRHLLPRQFAAMTISATSRPPWYTHAPSSSPVEGPSSSPTQAAPARSKDNRKSQSRKGKKRKLENNNDDDDDSGGDDEVDPKPDDGKDHLGIYPCVLCYGDSLHQIFCEIRPKTSVRAIMQVAYPDTSITDSNVGHRRHCGEVHKAAYCKDCWKRFPTMEQVKNHKPKARNNNPACPNPGCLNPDCPNWYWVKGGASCDCSERDGKWGPWENLCVLYENIVVGRPLPPLFRNNRHAERLSLRNFPADGQLLNTDQRTCINRWPETIAPDDPVSRALRTSHGILLERIRQWRSERHPIEEEVQQIGGDSLIPSSPAVDFAVTALRETVGPSDYALPPQENYTVSNPTTQLPGPVSSLPALQWVNSGINANGQGLLSVQNMPTAYTASSDASSDPYSYLNPSNTTAFTTVDASSSSQAAISPATNIQDLEKRIEQRLERSQNEMTHRLQQTIQTFENLIANLRQPMQYDQMTMEFADPNDLQQRTPYPDLQNQPQQDHSFGDFGNQALPRYPR